MFWFLPINVELASWSPREGIWQKNRSFRSQRWISQWEGVITSSRASASGQSSSSVSSLHRSVTNWRRALIPRNASGLSLVDGLVDRHPIFLQTIQRRSFPFRCRPGFCDRKYLRSTWCADAVILSIAREKFVVFGSSDAAREARRSEITAWSLIHCSWYSIRHSSTSLTVLSSSAENGIVSILFQKSGLNIR